jgi:phosphoribosyl 1,2-cyclic phosphate phosphodiesterase
MTLRAIILGCGTSSGVPRIGNDWGACDPAEPRNRRTRVSIIVESPTTRILVDTSPDMRGQLLAVDIADIDAILWTHDHADHCHGIDDIRQIMHRRDAPVPGYARAETLRHLQSRFSYAFQGREGYRSIISGHALPDELTIGDIAIRCTDMPHGYIYSTGFRFSHGDASIAYATDFHEVTAEMEELFSDVNIWIADALREKPHPTHASLGLTLDAAQRLRPGRTILTHMDQSMDYSRLRATLPATVEPGYDGMIVEA